MVWTLLIIYRITKNIRTTNIRTIESHNMIIKKTVCAKTLSHIGSSRGSLSLMVQLDLFAAFQISKVNFTVECPARYSIFSVSNLH